MIKIKDLEEINIKIVYKCTFFRLLIMNWYKDKIKDKIIIATEKSIPVVHKRTKQIKLAYMSKNHKTYFNDTDDSDGYNCKVQLTESKGKVTLTAMFLNDIHSFPLYQETWKYPKIEVKRAMKTFNRCVNMVEDIKIEYEDEELPGPTLQGMARETLRYLDIDRKKVLPSRSLEAALANGIRYQRVTDEVVQETLIVRQLSDYLQFPTASISSAISDGTNTFLSINSDFIEPIILKAENNDSLKIVIVDDLTGLLSLRFAVGGKVEQRK